MVVAPGAGEGVRTTVRRMIADIPGDTAAADLVALRDRADSTPDLLDDDGVRCPHGLKPLLRDGAHDADGKTRSGERLAPDDVHREPELLADAAHLVLEQQP